MGFFLTSDNFVHEKVNNPITVCERFFNKHLSWFKENGLELLIMDNDPKLHSKSVVTFMAENGVQIYPGSGKNTWAHHPFHDADVFLIHEYREENGYPLRGHDCQMEETEFAQSFEEAHQDLERREKKSKHKRTMYMRSSMLGTHGRLNTLKSSSIACQKSWKRSLKRRGENEILNLELN